MRQTARDARASARPRSKLEERFADEARFFGAWIDSPLKMGAVSPSGRFLARAMAQCVDATAEGLVIELGPGTGPVTEALLAHGVSPERLVLVEYDGAFCKLLERRFPKARVLRGDAYNLRQTLRALRGQKIACVVSSLPLLTRPERERIRLLDEAFALMGEAGAFVQFTYGLVSPMPLKQTGKARDYMGEVIQPVWLNLPPARVWRYTRVLADGPRVRKEPAPLAFLRKIAENKNSNRRAP